MKAMLSALVVMLLIAAGSFAVLDNSFQKSSNVAYTTTGARVGAGH